MPRIAAAFASSHSVMLTSTQEDWQSRFLERDRALGFFDRNGTPCTYDEVLARAPADAGLRVTPAAVAQRFEAVQADMRSLRTKIAAAKLDALIVLGDDQKELFDERMMPSIGIYYGDTIVNGVRPAHVDDWYVRAQMRRLEDGAPRHYPCDAALARHLIDGMMTRGFDITAMSGLGSGQHEGHAFSFVHRMYMAEGAVPIVPVFLNTFYPPNQPSPARCAALGHAIRDLVACYRQDVRIGVMASGGLSHFQTEEDLDHEVIAALRAGEGARLAGLDPRRLQSGSSEIRSWIALGAAASDLALDWISYTPGFRTPALTGTGLCFASWR